MEQQDCPEFSSLDVPDPEGAWRIFKFGSKKSRRWVKSSQGTTTASSLAGGRENSLWGTDKMVTSSADLFLPDLLDSASRAQGGWGDLQLNASYLEGICRCYTVGVLQPQGFSDGCHVEDAYAPTRVPDGQTPGICRKLQQLDAGAKPNIAVGCYKGPRARPGLEEVSISSVEQDFVTMGRSLPGQQPLAIRVPD